MNFQVLTIEEYNNLVKENSKLRNQLKEAAMSHVREVQELLAKIKLLEGKDDE